MFLGNVNCFQIVLMNHYFLFDKRGEGRTAILTQKSDAMTMLFSLLLVSPSFLSENTS